MYVAPKHMLLHRRGGSYSYWTYQVNCGIFYRTYTTHLHVTSGQWVYGSPGLVEMHISWSGHLVIKKLKFSCDPINLIVKVCKRGSQVHYCMLGLLFEAKLIFLFSNIDFGVNPTYKLWFRFLKLLKFRL